MNTQKRQNFKKKIWRWRRQNAPALPWRKTKNPYYIFVSEVMLQQTQIARVLIKYPRFLKAFPAIQSLAASPLRRVLSVWHGMGYNRRGLYLQQAAREIVKKHKGKIPKDIQALDALPGIGPYSARAIACFAHGVCEPFVETNIRRAIIHEFFPRKKNITDKEILLILQQIQPLTSNLQREWYWALMDYGRDALKHLPNANRKSKRYAKQSQFEGSPRYIRAKIISYLIANKKATVYELYLSLAKDMHLPDMSESDVETSVSHMAREGLVKRQGTFLTIA